MRIRPSVAWLVVIAAALAVLVIRYGGKRIETPLASAEQTTTPPPEAESAPTQPVGLPVQTSAPATMITASNTLSPLAHSKQAQILNILSNYNDVAIVFYNVRVNAGYESLVSRGQEVADGNGSFTILGPQSGVCSARLRCTGVGLRAQGKFHLNLHLNLHQTNVGRAMERQCRAMSERSQK